MQEAFERPRVSVVMTVYNGAAFVEDAVWSALDQTGVSLELIVVDDGSTDEGVAPVEAIADPRVRVIRLGRNRGVAIARNVGIEAARAEVVAFLDADDLCEPGRLYAQLRYLAEHPEVDVLGGAFAIIDGRGRQVGYRQYPCTHEQIVRRLAFACPLGMSTVAARKAAVRVAGGFTPGCRQVEDYDLWSRMALGGARFAALPRVLVRYRLHERSIKSTQVKAQLRGTIAVKRRYWTVHMETAAKLRLAAEHVLLRLPGWLILRLFVALTYRGRPSRGGARCGERGVS